MAIKDLTVVSIDGKILTEKNQPEKEIIELLCGLRGPFCLNFNNCIFIKGVCYIPHYININIINFNNCEFKPQHKNLYVTELIMFLINISETLDIVFKSMICLLYYREYKKGCLISP